MNSSSCCYWSRVFFSRQSVLLVVALGLALGGAGCGEKAVGPPPRYAVLRFENLSGDAALEWTGRAASEVLTRTLSGALDGPVLARTALARLSGVLGARPASVPGISTERTTAEAAGATHLIAGYIVKSGTGVQINATDTDLVTGKVVRTFSVSGESPLKALTNLSTAFSPKAGKPQTTNAEALRLYCISREETADRALPDLEKAVSADPNFGDAWVALVESQELRGNRPGAEAALAKARLQKLEPLDAAYLDFQASTLQGDPDAILVALKRVSDLSPGDTVLIRSLAELQTNKGQFAEAAASWKKLRKVIPNDQDALNQMGYSLAWSGDYAGAVAAMQDYARIRPGEPNPFDSLADVHYMYRKYAEAARIYQENHAKFPDFLEGGELYKAAWAKFMAGDRKGADTVFAQYRKLREKAPGTPLVSADWLFRTGRRKEGLAELRSRVEETEDNGEKLSLLNQLAVWELLEGDRVAAERDSKAAGNPTSAAAFLIRFCTLSSTTATEWQARANQMQLAPELNALRKLALAYALVLDGKKPAALPLWKELSEASKPVDFPMRAAWTLLKGEQPKLALVPDPRAINAFAAVMEPQPAR
jgi:tetratricopeptide (TPR) repeat protein/TolB-like protein